MSWNGPKEKKWEWYKHTKPCNNIITNTTCTNSDCNYAHTLDQYIDAILKRKFKLDFNIVNQLKLVDVDSELMKMDTEEEPSKKRSRSYMDVSLSKKPRTE
jgi:hypothetical protein